MPINDKYEEDFVFIQGNEGEEINANYKGMANYVYKQGATAS